jgi:chromosomal replication initiation ATPase DnaA
MDLKEQFSEVLQAVAAHTNEQPEDILSRKKNAKLSMGRKMTIFLFRSVAARSEKPVYLKDIASLMGWRSDHALVSRYFKEMWLLVRDDEKIRGEFKMLEQSLEKILH